ncbi:unnamed protein product, partial [Prorocentrum cordatum]
VDGTEAKLSDIFVETSTRNMTPHERAAFMRGKRKDLTEFFGSDVWEFHKLTGEEDFRRILMAKWVIKWTKNDDGTPRAMARLVLQGFNDPYALSSAVPTDAAELMGIEPDTLMKLIKPVCGQVDAPRRGWLRAVDDLRASGLKQHPLDPCVFLSFDEDGNSDGFSLLYVDDMLGGGDRRPGSDYNRAITEVKRKFKFRKWIGDDKMDYCGSDVTQTPHWDNPKSNSSEIEAKMATYAKNVKPITIDQKSSDNTRGLTIKEKRQLRGLLGALQWPSSQACPRLSASASIHRGQLPTATAGTAEEANKTLRFYKQSSDVGLKMEKIGQVCDFVFVAMTDAVWGVRQEGPSQGGYVILACHRKIYDGHESDFSVIDWKFLQAAAAGMGGLEFAKRFWAAMIYDGVGITKGERTHMAGGSAVGVDAKALCDAAQKESAASSQDMRTGIEAPALREGMEATMTRWRWVSSGRQYAGGLAKIAARQLLADRLRYGRLQLKHDPNYTAAKKKTKEERQESIDQTRPVTSAATRKATAPFMQLAVLATCCCRSAARSGCDMKGENDSHGIAIWFAMLFALLGLCGAYPVASYLIKTRGAECACKTELAVLRAKAAKERIEKESEKKEPPRDERGVSSNDLCAARTVGVQSTTTYKLTGDAWGLQHQTQGFHRAGEVTTEPELTEGFRAHK